MPDTIYLYLIRPGKTTSTVNLSNEAHTWSTITNVECWQLECISGYKPKMGHDLGVTRAINQGSFSKARKKCFHDITLSVHVGNVLTDTAAEKVAQFAEYVMPEWGVHTGGKYCTLGFRNVTTSQWLTKFRWYKSGFYDPKVQISEIQWDYDGQFNLTLQITLTEVQT